MAQGFNRKAKDCVHHFFAILLAASLCTNGCVTTPQLPLRVVTHVWPGYETLFLAKEKGFFGDAPIRLMELPAASESIRAFENGNADVATLTLDEVLRLADRGHEPRVILVMDFSRGADVILSRPEIKSLAELKGKSVGVEQHALGAYVLARALDLAGLRTEDVNVVPLLIAETEPAYKSGKVDAVVTFEPYRAKLLAAGARCLFDSSQIPDEIADVMIVRQSLLGNPSPAQQRSLKSLVTGHFRALEFLNRHRDEATAIMSRREQILPVEFLSSLERLSLPDPAENRRLLGAGDQTLVETMRRLSGVMSQHGILLTGRKEIDPAALRDDRFVKEILP